MQKTKSNSLYLTGAVLLVALIGCAAEERGVSVEPLRIRPAQKQQLMTAGRDVLMDMQFVIEKYDPDAGLIKTRPLSGAQFFEFWRKDNVTPRDSAQANLHSVQRIVQVSLSETGAQVLVDCDVNVRRLSIPEREFSAVSQAAGIFTTGDASLQRLELNKHQLDNMAWIDMGTDPALEKRILALIQNKLAQREGKS